MNNGDVASFEGAAIRRFVEALSEGNLRSTDAKLINIPLTTVFNVKGSTDDPKHIPGKLGALWKPLMISLGISADSLCYVTMPLPGSDSSHPQFNVGGHVTQNADGHIDVGGSCYLIPLCQWHNNTARDEVAFTVRQDVAIELTGYMEGELPVTFMLRRPSDHPFALLYRNENGWHYRDLAVHEAKGFQAGVSKMTTAEQTDEYILVERVRGKTTTHKALSSRLVA